ncbi:hypothetical protein IMZ48_30800 [Candidatus Bathyarchaeota archaeon]|nr:hypothetical protein [Candidatus Bathyarchaeota archaeon]
MLKVLGQGDIPAVVCVVDALCAVGGQRKTTLLLQPDIRQRALVQGIENSILGQEEALAGYPKAPR